MNTRPLKYLVHAALVLLPLLAACTALDQFLPTLDVNTPVPTAVATIAPEPTAAAIETPILMCTPPACAPGESYVCPTGDCPGGCGTICAAPTAVSGPLAPAPADWEGLEGWLTGLWRSNVNPAAVRAALRQSEVQWSESDWRAADLDGDLQDEWILSLYDPALPATPVGAVGDLWIVNGDGVIFRYYAAPSDDVFTSMAPEIVIVQDLTGDGRPEVVADAPICGAHTCTGRYRVIGQTPDGLDDLVRREPIGADDTGTTIVMASPDIFVSARGDGTSDLVVSGGIINSVGAGTMRGYSEIWHWDGTAFTLAETRPDPTNVRHLLLYEANDRLAAGDLSGALALYEAVINDPSLVTVAHFHTDEQVYADISAFAAFRLILIDLLEGLPSRAAGRLEWLRANYPDAAATGAAATLMAGWSDADGQAALCAEVENSLATLDNPTGTLSDMGYGNPSLGAADFCP